MAAPATARTQGRTRQAVIVAAWLAALTANVIHNNIGVDPAIAPASVLLALYWWKPVRPLLWATALFIALPSFLFLRFPALANPGNTQFFLNHLALLAAGILAAAAVLLSFRR